MKYEIPVTRNPNPKPKPDQSNLGFGKYFTDHLLIANYSAKKGEWYDPRIVPYGPIPMDPAASVFHYSQELFEGLKAYRSPKGEILLFRPQFNSARLNQGARRLCMAEVPESLFIQGITSLLRVDQDWVPTEKGTAMYIRPTLIASEAFLGVRPSDEYLFFIILSPAGNYYSNQAAGVKIWIETDQVRAAPGGLGAVKAGANYAASLQAAAIAKKTGYSQVLWLDSIHREFIEEVGTMNVFIKLKGGKVVTPPLSGTILSGNTRSAALTLLRDWKMDVQEVPVSLKQINQWSAEGILEECWGTGTAAVISPVSELASKDHRIQFKLDSSGYGETSRKLLNELTQIQTGQIADPHGWMLNVSSGL